MKNSRSPYKTRHWANPGAGRFKKNRSPGKEKKKYSDFPTEERTSLVSLFDITEKRFKKIWNKI